MDFLCVCLLVCLYWSLTFDLGGEKKTFRKWCRDVDFQRRKTEIRSQSDKVSIQSYVFSSISDKMKREILCSFWRCFYYCSEREIDKFYQRTNKIQVSFLLFSFRDVSTVFEREFCWLNVFLSTEYRVSINQGFLRFHQYFQTLQSLKKHRNFETSFSLNVSLSLLLFFWFLKGLYVDNCDTRW